jgi:hypothetical protein
MQTIQFLAILMAAASEMAGENIPTRRLMVNIPARKIVLMEDGKILKMYSVAVGKQSTPSPSGTFHIASHVVNPTYTHDGKVVRPLDESGFQGLRHPRNESSGIHRARRVARVHPAAKS